MTTILHLSDLHFGTEQPAAVLALLDLAHATDPDAIVVSGDITQRARRRQFERARHFLRQLPQTALFMVPGNHDLPLFHFWNRFVHPYRNYTTILQQQPVTTLITEALLLVGVNATSPYRFKRGKISEEMLQQSCAELRRSNRRQLRIVVVHHPLTVRLDKNAAGRLHGHARFADAWSQAGADLVLSGHMHVPDCQRIGHPGLWSISAGSAVSARIRHDRPNSVNILRHAPLPERSVVLEQWDYCADHRQFRRQITRNLHLLTSPPLW